GSFGSKFGVIAAAAGSAIGLGNIWRFPYVVGENGGGAFLLINLLCILLIGMPLMLSEFVIGRRAQRNAYGAFKKLAPGTPWFFVGLMGVVTAFVILSFYSTVAGWTLEYVFKSVSNSFSGKNPEGLKTMFESFVGSSWRPVLWQLLFLALTAGIVLSGVKKGIEKYSKILMPLLLVLIIALCVRSVTLPGAVKGLEFLFKPDFSKVTGRVILEALGQAFFSLSIGMGALITYGSYIGKKDNLTSSAVIVSFSDTFIAILAGVAIFPAVFAFGINPAEGPELVFLTLPNIFLQMPGGYFFSILFFILLLVAALTSSISVLEVVVAYFVEEINMNRKSATWIATLSIAFMGVFCTLSQGALPGLRIGSMNLFDVMDFTSSKILLPFGGFLIVLFIGWYLKPRETKAELSNEGTLHLPLFNLFLIIVRFVAPVAIAMVFLYSIGLIG
ncbi:MAG: sodium-dependent transporter, partial [Negativicutes bacterium]|nr:sodium-dependent transporter [Negativicutes bacterium]